MTNSVDVYILEVVNSLAHRNPVVDGLIVYIMNSLLLIGGVPMALFAGAWATTDDSRDEQREVLLFGLFGSVFSVFLARTLALVLPFRARPLHNPLLLFHLPYGMDPASLLHWSSFPSDHAAVFFCLATSIYMASRRLGIIALAHATFVVCLPRIYSGVHYPSDILAGAALGSGIAYLAASPKIRNAVVSPAFWCKKCYPALFYVCLFLCAFEVAELFGTVRDIAFPAFHALHAAVKNGYLAAKFL